MAKAKVYVTRRVPKPGMDLLAEHFDIDVYEDEEAIPHDVLVNAMKAKPYDALYCLLTDDIDKEVLEAAGPQLRIVATMSVGYEHIDLQECAKRDILVANTPGVSTDSVAELTVALLLMTARRLSEGVESVKQGEWGDWRPKWLCGTELTGATLGIYGLGRIGFNVGRRLKPFGFSQIYYTDVHEVSYAKDIDAEFIDFDGLIQKCDFICVCCNLTPQTRHMFNADVFKKMKNNAILINTGRGGVIQHDDLVEALKNGDIAAAGLDVTEPEPLPLDHPLVLLKNCVILPHMGSNTWDSRNAMSEIAARNCIAAISNQTPEGNVCTS
ncbi:glyoxylate reductase/hydroxypyruvate reductase [Plakobranchus ocellatus]|uniref:Glyoxylate reductase/hydroxypyruvate reductase n=1 Tax=Plakobranchus ocellatus TaxID=259542 RepID=A0AAV4ALI4_9GAST|nr:glyoxylate reductase/hydroxypyruvate reductase [Plakobranchus ocellatus]